MLKGKKQVLRIIAALVAPVIVFFFAKNLPAGFNSGITRTFVEIDGTDFGTFDNISGVEDALRQKDANGDTFLKVSLRRDFVTDPSLYLWAKRTTNERQGLKDIHLVKQNEQGEEVGRYVLRLCQPLSWSVAAANPALGGFHESVDIAVQEISFR